jgi:Ca2+-binding EF-hand superfamily protein
MTRILPCLAVGIVFVFMAPTALAQLPDSSALAQADTNGDGILSEAEFLEYRSALFGGLVADANGGIGLDELQALFPSLPQRLAARHFRDIDSDGDGFVNEREWEASPPKAFRRADKNNDGQLDGSEMGQLGARQTSRHF